MSILSTWVVTITGVAVLMTACEIAMPDGEMNKYVKSILSIICLFILISPVPKLLSQPIDFSELLGGDSTVNLDFSFLDYINAKKADVLAQEVQEFFVEKGYEGVKVGLAAKANSAEFVIESAVLDVSGCGQSLEIKKWSELFYQALDIDVQVVILN